MNSQLNLLKVRLERFRTVFKKEFPNLDNPLPCSDNLDIKNLKDGSVNTDSCHAAQKAHCLLTEVIPGQVWQQDCHHHLRNVWFKAMEKALTKKLNNILRKSLEQIAPELRVTCSFSAIARAYDKGFSQNANYVKGWGEDFAPWHKKFKSTEPLYHVENAQGSRHDLCLLAAPAFYMNRLTCLEYMDTKLRLPKKKDNILMQATLRKVCKLYPVEIHVTHGTPANIKNPINNETTISFLTICFVCTT